MKYNAVIFDLFGTLVDNYIDQEYGTMLSEMAGALSISCNDFIRIWKRTVGERMSGQVSTTETGIESICAEMGIYVHPDQVAVAAQIRLDFTRNRLIPLPDALATLSQLKQLGCKTGLLTDCTAEVPVLWRETPFASLIDATVFSCNALCMKPNPAIYYAVCEKLCVDPTQCLYIGDGSSHELTGARSVRMHPVLIESVHDMQGFHRDDVLNWDGQVISSLSEVIAIVMAKD